MASVPTLSGVSMGSSRGPSPTSNRTDAAERVGDDQNIREDDGGVEVEAADRLQRHLGGIIRREAQIEKAAGLGAQFTVFRQIAPGLPHHP